MHPKVQAIVKPLIEHEQSSISRVIELGCWDSSILSLALVLRFMVLINGKYSLAEININEGEGART